MTARTPQRRAAVKPNSTLRASSDRTGLPAFGWTAAGADCGGGSSWERRPASTAGSGGPTAAALGAAARAVWGDSGISALGTATLAWHFLQRIFLPARVSDRLCGVSQAGQRTGMGMGWNLDTINYLPASGAEPATALRRSGRRERGGSVGNLLPSLGQRLPTPFPPSCSLSPRHSLPTRLNCLAEKSLRH